MKRLKTLALVLAFIGLVFMPAFIGHSSQSDPDVYTTTAPGATFVPNVENALKAVQSMNSGSAAPAYCVTGTWHYDTDDDTGKFYEGSAWCDLIRVDRTNNRVAVFPDPVTLADDATPSVKGVTFAYLSSTGANTITTFDDGVAGQVLDLMSTGTHDTIAGALTKTGMTIPLIANDTLRFIYTSSGWRQIAGSVGMGRYVPLAEPDAIGDWIAVSVTAYGNVDVSDDGVRKGACAVSVSVVGAGTTTTAGLFARKNGATIPVNVGVFWQTAGVTDSYYCFSVALDDDAVFEAAFTVNKGGTTGAKVIGYYI